MPFKLVFAKTTLSSCFLFFSLIIDLYFFIPIVIAQLFNPIAELVIPIRIPSKEKYPAIAETKKRKVFRII